MPHFHITLCYLSMMREMSSLNQFCCENRPRLLVAVLVSASWLMAGDITSAHADQKNPDLPALFDRLSTADNPAQARDVASRIWQIWAAHPDPVLSAELASGTLLMEGGRLGAATDIFTKIVKTDPQFAEAWNKRATAYFQMGKFVASKQDIARTLELEPRHFGALSGLGLVEMHLGNYEAALSAYLEAQKIYPAMREIDEIIAALQALAKGQPL